MKSIVTGSKGRIGSLLMRHATDPIGLDLPEFDLSKDGWAHLFEGVDIVYHCAGCAEPTADAEQHVESLIIAANVAAAVIRNRVPKIYFCGSSWGSPITDDRPQTGNTKDYGAAKRAIKELASMNAFDGTYVEIGWYTGAPMPFDCPEWLKVLYWNDEDVIKAFGL